MSQSTAAPWLATANDLAAMHNITPRRVTQYRDDGYLPTIERGRFDLGFFTHLRCGELRARNTAKRPDRDTLVALGWLVGMGEDELSNEDLNLFCDLFQRNGLTREAALIAIGRAQAWGRK